jgi:hypothetical protein
MPGICVYTKYVRIASRTADRSTTRFITYERTLNNINVRIQIEEMVSHEIEALRLVRVEGLPAPGFS